MSPCRQRAGVEIKAYLLCFAVNRLHTVSGLRFSQLKTTDATSLRDLSLVDLETRILVKLVHPLVSSISE